MRKLNQERETLVFLKKIPNNRLSKVLLPETGCTDQDSSSKDGDSVLYPQFQGTKRRCPFQVSAKKLFLSHRQINLLFFHDLVLNHAVFRID